MNIFACFGVEKLFAASDDDMFSQSCHRLVSKNILKDLVVFGVPIFIIFDVYHVGTNVTWNFASVQ